jgi:hypothetical protein
VSFIVETMSSEAMRNEDLIACDMAEVDDKLCLLAHNRRRGKETKM